MSNKPEKMNSEDMKFKQILYDNLEMLFAKLDVQNEELDKIETKLNNREYQKKEREEKIILTGANSRASQEE